MVSATSFQVALAFERHRGLARELAARPCRVLNMRAYISIASCCVTIHMSSLFLSTSVNRLTPSAEFGWRDLTFSRQQRTQTNEAAG
jgi:hypothetical protein